MGGFDVKPGAMTARDFARANTPEPVPGKQTLVQSLQFRTGEPWIDQGGHGACHGRAGQPGCFLSDDQRAALIANFQTNVGIAQENYKIALQSLRVDQLIAKDEDLSWVLSLALDLAGAHIVGALSRAIGRALGPGLAEVKRLGDSRAVNEMLTGISDTSWTARAHDQLAKITPAKIEATTKAVFDAGPKAAGKKALGAALDDVPSKDERKATVSYIDELTDNCDMAYQRFSLDASASADDALLVVLWQGMKPEHHKVNMYRAALEAKIQRFKKSGVTNIGEKTTSYGEGKIQSKTRVVLVRDIHGQTAPWYEKQVSDIYDRGKTSTGDWQLSGPVPEEFRDIAIQRSELVWGKPRTIDDGFVQQLEATRQDVEAIRKKLIGNKPDPAQQKKPTTPTQAFTESFERHAHPPAPLPAGSVFAGGQSTTAPVFSGGANAPLYAPGSVFDLPEQKRPEPDPADPLAAFRTVTP